MLELTGRSTSAGSGAVSPPKHTNISPKKTERMEKSMCHDCFYVALPDKKVGFKTRQLRMTTLKRAAVDDEEQPIYNDEPDSSSSSSIEDTEAEQETSAHIHPSASHRKRGKEFSLISPSKKICSVVINRLSLPPVEPAPGGICQRLWLDRLQGVCKRFQL